MQWHKLKLVPFLLAVVIFAAGCTAATSYQAKAQPTSGAAGQAGAAKDAAPASAEKQAVPQTGGGSGGLVMAVDPQNSEARYRVREQLVNVDLPSDAVGKTKSISGSITINPDGSIDTANSKFVVDVSTLQSDRSMRDNFLRRAVLQTNQYPNATFVPTQVSGLSWPLPQSGPVKFQLTGNLTIRDVTKPVTWDVTGNIQDIQAGKVSGSATTSFTFEDFNLQQPRVPVVLSIVDKITLEVDLAIQPAAR